MAQGNSFVQINDPGLGQVMLRPDVQVRDGEVVGGNQNAGGASLGVAQPCLIGSTSGVISRDNDAAMLLIFLQELDVSGAQAQGRATVPSTFEPPHGRQGD